MWEEGFGVVGGEEFLRSMMTAVAPRIYLSSPQISFNYFTILSVLGGWAVGLDNKITDYIILNVYKSNDNVMYSFDCIFD